MIVCAIPSVLCMAVALLTPRAPNFQMNAVWAGLALVMTLRTLSIYLPFRMRIKPFDKLNIE